MIKSRGMCNSLAYFYRYIFLIVISLAVFPVNASVTPSINLNPLTKYLLDKDNKLDIYDVKRDQDWKFFKGNGLYNKTYEGPQTVWLYLDLSQLVDDSNYIISTGWDDADFITAYFLLDGKIVDKQYGGDGFPISHRAIKHVDTLFAAPFRKGAKLEMYISIKDAVVFLPLKLWKADDFNDYGDIKISFISLLVGAAIAIALYNICVLAYFPSRVGLFYCFYVIAFLAIVTHSSGYGFYYLWPNDPGYNNLARHLTFGLFPVVALLFSYTFLEVQNHKFIKYWFLGLMVIMIVLLLSAIQLPHYMLQRPVLMAAQLIFLNIMLAALYLAIKGEKTAILFTVGWCFYLVSSVLIFLLLFDLIVFNNLIVYSNLIGGAVQMILHSISLVDKYKQHSSKYRQAMLQYSSDLEEEVSTRTRDLKQTIGELHNTRDKLVQAEKMASLGRLVTGVAHEVNTPLGIGMTSTSLLKEDLQKLSTAFKDNTLQKSDLENYMATSNETLNMAHDNLSRVSKLVADFKEVSVDEFKTHINDIVILESLENAISSYKKALENNVINVSIEGDTDITIRSFPKLFTRLFGRLIENSIDHAFDNTHEKEINISITRSEHDVEIIYSDNGNGLSEEEDRNIFEPFFTSQRFSGHVGLGAFIIFNTATHGLGGDIQYQSKKGKGLTYTIHIPLDVDDNEQLSQ